MSVSFATSHLKTPTLFSVILGLTVVTVSLINVKYVLIGQTEGTMLRDIWKLNIQNINICYSFQLG